jgi:hypothetical protein
MCQMREGISISNSGAEVRKQVFAMKSNQKATIFSLNRERSDRLSRVHECSTPFSDNDALPINFVPFERREPSTCATFLMFANRVSVMLAG